jgi:hypothetical protein
MALALLGYVGISTEQALALEVARLRARVASLEAELEQLRTRAHTELDLELHTIAGSTAPVLT